VPENGVSTAFRVGVRGPLRRYPRVMGVFTGVEDEAGFASGCARIRGFLTLR
jgi:hypothetical protein